MTKQLRIALAQANMVVGDLEGNLRKIENFSCQARDEGAEIVAFPELAITGYPPEDLLLKPQFLEDNLKALQYLVESVKDIALVVGYVEAQDDIFNAAAVICNGEIVSRHYKHFLPNYSVFDENRYFQKGDELAVVEFNRCKIGVNICEDIWYPDGPCLLQTLAGAEVVLNISSSPYHRGKERFREKMLSVRASDHCAIVAFVNLVGGQDELVFDGGSMVFTQTGRMMARAPMFREHLLVADLNVEGVFRTRLHDPRRRKDKERLKGVPVSFCPASPVSSMKKVPLPAPVVAEDIVEEEEIFQALVVGTRDYVRKNGFKKVLIGLSGGIDSSLVAVVAAEALGGENVVGVLMPSQYTSGESNRDAYDLAENLGVETHTLPIKDVFGDYKAVLKEVFKDLPEDTTEENLQARIRGNYLMAMSNKYGWLVLTTGNKSEMSCGYATLYGDMAGGYAVLKDLLKTMVFRVSEHVNRRYGREVIPRNVLIKPPSAELKPDQTDQDTLPPYEVLDAILDAYVEKDRSFAEIVGMGYEEDLVARVIRMVDLNEYKRRQAPPGVKLTSRAFGKDRRLPITNRYRPYRREA